MKESTIITQFGQLNKKMNMVAEALKKHEQHIHQVYAIENAVSVTIDALIKLLIEKNLFTDDEMKASIDTENKRRQAKRDEVKNAEVQSQPNFGEESNVMPSPDEG